MPLSVLIFLFNTKNIYSFIKVELKMRFVILNSIKWNFNKIFLELLRRIFRVIWVIITPNIRN